MTSPPPPQADPDDDFEWLSLLAGRDAPHAHAHTRLQATRLRAAILAQPATLPAGAAPDPAGLTQRLLERARRSGITTAHAGAAGTPGRPGPGGRRTWALLGGALVGLLVAVTAGPWLLAPPPEEDAQAIERGSDLQQLTADDPHAARARLQQALAAAGLHALPYERLGRPGLDVELPQPLTPAAQRALQAQGLQRPPGPVLRVEFLQRGAAPPAARAAPAASATAANATAPTSPTAASAPSASASAP